MTLAPTLALSLAPTTSPEQAAGRTWDLVVIGAGPAGATAAREIACAGAGSVLLIDKAAFPRAKACGCCLNAAAVQTLCSIGLGGVLDELRAVPVSTWRVWGYGRTVELPLRPGVAVSRAAFDSALAAAAVGAGADFLPETRAEVGEVQSGSRVVRVRRHGQTAELRCRLVIAADGIAGGSLRREPARRARPEPDSLVGVAAVLDPPPGAPPPGVIDMTCGRSGYVGMVRLEDGRLNLAAALDPTAVAKKGVAAVVQGLFDDARRPGMPTLAGAARHGTPPLTWTVPRRVFDRVLLVGDSAGYVEPFTGEGMAWALGSAVTAAGLAVRFLATDSAATLRQWERLHREIVGPGSTLCRVLARCLRSPALTAASLTAVSLWPAVARPFLDRVGRPSAMTAAPSSVAVAAD